MKWNNIVILYSFFGLPFIDIGNHCPANYFQCVIGSCIPLSWKCDLKVDCPDSSDEAPAVCSKVKTCTEGQFQCRITQLCIPSEWVCDGEQDCGSDDSSDEDSVSCRRRQKCLPNQSECSGGVCIDTEKFCDGKFDCINDEYVENCRK